MTVVVILLTFWLQAPTLMNGGLGWDDAVYYDLALKIAHGEPVRGGVPFVYRPALPWLAATLSPDNLRRGFLIVNLSCVVLASVAFQALLRQFVDKAWIRALCFAMFVCQFHGLARFIPFRNFMVDAPATALFFAGVLVVQRWKSGPAWRWCLLLAAIVGVGAFVREVVLIPSSITSDIFSPPWRTAYASRM